MVAIPIRALVVLLAFSIAPTALAHKKRCGAGHRFAGKRRCSHGHGTQTHSQVLVPVSSQTQIYTVIYSQPTVTTHASSAIPTATSSVAPEITTVPVASPVPSFTSQHETSSASRAPQPSQAPVQNPGAPVSEGASNVNLTPNGNKAGIAGGDSYPFVKDHIGWWYDW
ncbi:hypothetical protein HGRIS_003495 [Hohenbuehelia grisea]|uniref:Uncharacterized protein n=1 Tax=Hohenbuehelia grisea TaxID=104357 RepID=A0ABR3JFM4_9AGAR